MPLPDRRAIWFERLTRAVRGRLDRPACRRFAHALLVTRADSALDDEERLAEISVLVDEWGEDLDIGPRPR